MMVRARPRQHVRRTRRGPVIVNVGVRKHNRRLTSTASVDRVAGFALKGEVPKGTWFTDDPKYERLFADELRKGDRGPVVGGVVTIDADIPDDKLYRDGRHWRLSEPVSFRDKVVRPPLGYSHKSREPQESSAIEPRKTKYLLIARTGEVLGNKEGYDTPAEALKLDASSSPYTFLKKYYPKEEHD